MPGTDKITRILNFFYRLTSGEYINKSAFTMEHNITERSFDRDVEDIRIFLSEIYTSTELIFDKKYNAYYLTGYCHSEISSVEILALLKILIDSRAFRKDEMVGLISTISNLISNDNKRKVSQLIYSEMDNYISPTHNKSLLKIHWDLEQGILKKQIIELHYFKANGQLVNRIVSPISIVFSEYYFYLVAFRDDERYDYPAFFRLDRIESFKLTNRTYSRKLYEEYNVGNMKNSIQFMYAGELINVKLRCVENSIEAIMDRLPNARVIEKDQEYSIIEAKVFGDGFIRWVLSQGSSVEILEPIEYRKEIREQAINILNIYSVGKDDNDG